MSAAGSRIVITGAAGHLGTRLARRCTESGAAVLGLDIRREPGSWPPQAAFEVHDTTASSLRRRLVDQAPTVLVHLARMVDPAHDRAHQRLVNVDGTRNAFAAAAAAGARRIVYPSTTMSYGIDASRARPLVEQDRPDPGPGYPAAAHQAAVEQWLPAFRSQHPQIDVVVPRFCPVIGRHTDNAVTRMCRWPLMFRVAGSNPPLQFLHEADAVDMLWWAIDEAPATTFNAAGRGVVLYREVCRIAGKPCLALPAWVLYPLVGLVWRLGLSRFPPGLLDYLRYCWVADTTRMTDDLGFRPRFGSREALFDDLYR